MFSNFETDCVHLLIKSAPYQNSGQPLLLSDVLFCLRDVMDLSHYIPTKDSPRKLVFSELQVSHPELSLEELTYELSKNKQKAGKLSLEIPFTQSFFSIPMQVLLIREKCYAIEILFQKSESDEVQFTSKIAARSIPRYRAAKFSLKDFAKFSSAEKVEFSRNLAGLRAKNFCMFEIEYSRRNITRFSKKRFQISSGETFPFNFYLNSELEFLEGESCLPLAPQILQMMSS